MITNKHHPRRQARIAVFQGLYAQAISGEPADKVIRDLWERYSFERPGREFVQNLLTLVDDHHGWVEETIKQHLQNWDYERVALLDRLILQMAITEIYFVKDVPPKVSIAEAIEIAKEYSTEESSAFVNGILDAVYKEYQSQKT
ncbi:MAG: transcription antitermination factor NusB [FCB group bacterium]|nr:transcription antitermination factor NusB [FCB group bacterium]